MKAEIVYSGLGQMAPGKAFWPEGNAFSAGKLKFFPELVVGVDYNDNIFYDETGTEQDIIGHIVPRLRIDYSLKERGKLSVGYAGDFAYYAEFSDNDWQRHDLAFLVDYNAPSGLFFDAANNYVDTSDPFGSQDDYGVGIQKERMYNLLSVGLGYNYSDVLKILGYFDYTIQEYEDDEIDYSQDFDEISYGVGIEKRFSYKTWGFFRYFRLVKDYTTASPDPAQNESSDADSATGSPDAAQNESNDADYTSDFIELGVTWDATSRVTGELGFGYEWRELDNPVDPNDIRYNDIETWIASTSINYSIKPDVTDIHFAFNRRNHQRGSNTYEYFEGTYLNIHLRHRFYSWYSLLLNFGMGRNDYNTDRQDDDIRAAISIEYLILRRFTLALGYDYTKRDSNIPGNSFTINRLLGTVTWRY